MGAVRKIEVDTTTCIGCQACTHMCPADLITFSDSDGQRTLKFAKTCAENCSRCADACSESAIRLEPTDASRQEYFTVQFPLMPCAVCDAHYATEKMVDKLHTSVPSLLMPQDIDWLNTCLKCRRTHEAKQVAGRGLMRRSFGS